MAAEPFVSYLREIYGVAKPFALPGIRKPANQLVMEWLRHFEYGGWDFAVLVGPIDQDFISIYEVNSTGLYNAPTFVDPANPTINMRISHLGATMNGAYLDGLPGDGTSVASLLKINSADMAGWGGDLIQFCGEWMQVFDQYPDPGAYCDAMLFEQASARFKLEELLEDVDGFNIGLKLKNDPSLAIPDAVSAYYTTGYKRRLRDFWNVRFAAVDAQGRAEALVAAMAKGVNVDGVLSGVTFFFGTQMVQRVAYGKLAALPNVSSDQLSQMSRGFLRNYKDLMTEEAARFPDP